jgi:hypothetical protein
MPKLPFKPMLAETLLGGAIGAGRGYTAAETEDRGKEALKGGLKGLGYGAAFAVGSRAILRGSDKVVANMEDQIRSTASKFHSEVSSAVGTTMGEEKLYEKIYNAKRNSRRFLKDQAQFIQRRHKTSNGVGTASTYYRLRPDGKVSPWSPEGQHIAENMANKQFLDKYRENYVDFASGADRYGEEGHKFLGGLRGLGKSVVDQSRLTNKQIRFGLDTNSAATNLQRGTFRQMFFGGEPQYSVVGDSAISKMQQSPEFLKRLKDVRAGAVRDARKGTQGRFFEHRAGGAKASVSTKPITEHFKVLGLKQDVYATKKDVDKHIKGMWKKNHPDLTQDPAEKVRRETAMKGINEAAEAVRNSGWYEKLAFVRQHRK